MSRRNIQAEEEKITGFFSCDLNHRSADADKGREEAVLFSCSFPTPVPGEAGDISLF